MITGITNALSKRLTLMSSRDSFLTEEKLNARSPITSA